MGDATNPVDAWIQADPRRAAIWAGRIRCVVGTLLLVMPGWAARLEFGPGAERPAARWMLRMVGVRDIVLGLGMLISASERSESAGWVSMMAVTDAADGALALGVRGLPARSRLFVVPALVSAALHWRIAQALADATTADQPEAD